MNSEALYEQFEQRLADPKSAMDFLEEHFRESGNGHRLFEVLKMRTRWGLGLPLMALPAEQHPADLSQKLEDGLIAACREVAELYFGDGNLVDGWTYLHPVGDDQLSSRLLQSVVVDETNSAAVIDVCFYQGVLPGYGYRTLLQRMGTCDGITAFDMHAMQFDRTVVAELASVLLNHFHEELLTNVITNVKESKFEVTSGASLGQLLDEHLWLVTEGGHHVDATHLASVVRIAKQTVDKEDHRKALELCRYGRRLPADFHFKSDPPFESIYIDHEQFFQALVGENREQALAWFADKVVQHQGDMHEPVAIEVLIDLQVRAGQRDEAVATMTEKMWGFFNKGEVPGSVFDVARTQKQFEMLSEKFQSHEDFAGFAFARLCGSFAEVTGTKKDPPPK